MSIVNEYLIAMERCFREFDASAFVRNGKNAIAGHFTPQMITLDGGASINSIQYVISTLENTIGDPKGMLTFLNSVRNSPRFENIGMFPGMHTTDINFYLNYLKEYSDNIDVATGKLVDDIRNGNPNAVSVYVRTTTGNLSAAVKKQVVRSSVDLQNMTSDEMMAAMQVPKVNYTREYIDNYVVPFVSMFPTIRVTTLRTAQEFLEIVQDMIRNANSKNAAVKAICEQYPKYCKDINRVNYQINRDVMGVISFVTSALLIKTHCFTENAMTCNALMTRLQEISAPVRKIVTEGVFSPNIIPDNTGSVADALINGRIESYEVLAKNVMEFHKGVLHQMLPVDCEDPDAMVDEMISSVKYPEEPYNSILEIFTVIASSLEVIKSASDDYLLVFDELIDKAGLEMEISVRYKDRIQLVSATPEYDSATEIMVNGEGNRSIYYQILNEINSFPKNIQMIADQAKDLKEKIDELDDRFVFNVNAEYKNSNAIEELKVWIKGFKEQYTDMMTMIAGNFMIRLKKLACNAERISVKIEGESDTPVGLTESFDDLDYELEIERAFLEYERGYTDLTMKTLLESFNIARMESTQHLRLIQEIGDEAAQKATPTTPATDPNAGKNAADINNVNGAAKAKTAGAIDQLKKKLTDKIMDIINKFLQNMQNKLVPVYNITYPQFVKTYKDTLLNRSYANTSLEILPYETKMPFNNIISEVEAMRNRISNIKSQDVQQIKTASALMSRLFASYGVRVNGTDDLATCKSSAQPVIEAYFKVGKGGQLQMVTYANGNLQALMQSIINFCDQFYNGDSAKLTNALKGLSQTVSGMSNNFVVNESADLIMQRVSMMLEADETAPGNENKVSTTPVVKTNGEPGVDSNTPNALYDNIQSITFFYSGCVLNAVRDRLTDYFTAMSKFAPKNGTEGQNAQPQQPAQPTQQA